MNLIKTICLVLLISLTACLEDNELNAAQQAKQATPFEPIKVYSYCPDEVICYVKTPNNAGYTGMSCLKDQELYEKYCDIKT